mmetsp:Transcript_2120/g.6037  ORF Transcript_2120/g.6037 Transcript_2120/m.6037 type:complete len:172 (-) Transcript_2120:338-853(-)
MASSQVLAAWSKLPVERRRQAIAVRDTELMTSLQGVLRTLMTAEIDAAGRGDATEDKSGLVLLSAMEFDMPDGVMDTQAAGCSIVWPAEMHSEPARLMQVASRALGFAEDECSAFDPSMAAVGRLRDLAEPLPTSWQELETCLARFVQQAILTAVRPFLDSAAAAAAPPEA